ncbi:autotransporter-associated N-terminal domain-containing protein [Fusobacterium pseudoperiodonticum]|uniref:Autotransporter domain-containing protein n=1 Tax=Fusobacterium pseudoperiodonticum TaxID=2663009 RepID=A0A2G9EFB1_9FUSO|nr:autotransporter-associated N-terminal domain-containing protein [Fusobacterium pseudoperiodonticum]PIM79555.1 autotransporter domain-containing protein [Fusobacterium pseudoperiodonticum]
MNRNLQKIEKDLRSIAKRYKSVKYSIGLAILFLMMGLNAFSADVNTELDTANYTGVVTREGIKDSVDNLQDKIKGVRLENTKSIEALRLELIQLMEQGNQVVKSPWASWQFGIGYLFTDLHGRERGTGDKSIRYRFESYYTRYDWKTINASDGEDSERPQGSPLLVGKPGGLGSSSSILGKTVNKNGALSSSVNGRNRYGLVDLRYVKEKPTDVEIFAKVNPKKIEKDPLNVDPPKFELKEPQGLSVNPYIAKPEEAPTIKLPNIGQIKIEALNITAPSAPSAPTISVTVNKPSAPAAPNVSVNVVAPTINVLNIDTPAPASVSAPTVETPKPVAFSVAPTIDATGDNKKVATKANIDAKFPAGVDKVVNVTEVSNTTRNYLTFANPTGNGTNAPTINEKVIVNVELNDARAMVIDEPENNSEFKMGGTINLYKSKNMGIDLQGKANGTGEVLATISNTNKIIGHYKDENGNTNKNQIAFGFSNVDASRNDTMTHIKNEGTITLNAPESAAIQLKAEDPHNFQPIWDKLSENGKIQMKGESPNSSKGRVLMKADNQSEINIDSSESFGIITVFNKGVSELDVDFSDKASTTFKADFSDKTKSNLKSQRSLGGATILPGGEIGRSSSSDSKWTSGVYNSGTINITGDKSVGVGILQEIQEVKVGGTINIGTTAVTQEGNRNSGNLTDKVEGAVGIYAAVPTMPILKGETGTYGTVATDDVVGTKTVEFGRFGKTGAVAGTDDKGIITIGANATKSIGLLVSDNFEELNNGSLDEKDEAGNTISLSSSVARKLKRSGSITAKADAKVVVQGESNYGFVVSSDSYKSEFPSLDNLKITRDKTNYGIGINEGAITVQDAKDSIGFALLKGGNSKNTGTLKVTGTSSGSAAFYGEQDNFTNEGAITVDARGSGNTGILLNGKNATPISFTNTANISVSGKGNIGLYATGKSKFSRPTGATTTDKISVKEGATGIYVENLANNPTGGTVVSNIEISVPVEIGNSNPTTGTTIGFLSKANADDKIHFKDGFNLKVGKNSVGLYSTKTNNFNDVFDFNLTTTANVTLDEGATFSFFNDANSTGIGAILVDKKLKFDMAKGSTLGYIKNGATARIDKDLDTTVNTKFGTISEVGTSLLLATGNASTAKIDSGKTVKTTTNVGLISTDGAKAINEGTLKSNIVSGVGLYSKKATAENNSTASIITMNKEKSAAIFGENNSTLINEGTINLEDKESGGILAKDSNATNKVNSAINVKKGESAGIAIETTLDKTVTPNVAVAIGAKTASNEGTITLENNSTGSAGSAAMLGKRAAGTPNVTLSNSGTINVDSTGSVGINADNAVGAKDKFVVDNSGIVNVKKNSSAGINAITSTVNTVKDSQINLTAEKTAGIIAKTGSEVINNGKISTSVVSVTAAADGLVGISADASTVTNGSTGEITLGTAYSAGIYGTGTGTNTSTIKNAGDITANEKNSVGIYVEANSTAENTGKITMKKEGSAAMYGDESKITNKKDGTAVGKIIIEGKDSAAMYAKNTDATNDTGAEITVKNEGSAGMYIDVDKANIKANGTNKGTITLDTGAKGSAGILAKLGTSANQVTTITNEGEIKVDGGDATKPSVAISAENLTGTVDNLLVKNKGNINLNSEKSIGLFLDKSKAINETDGNINVKEEDATGVFAKNKADFENKGTITVEAPTNKKAVGVFATDEDTKVVNSKNIKVLSKNSVGMFGKVKATVQNKGTIDLGTTGSSLIGLIGMFGQSDSDTKPVTIENLNNGIINVNTKSSAGMYADNTAGAGKEASVTLKNEGTININKEKSAGIYAPKSTVSKVGKVNLADDANGASAVYIEDGGVVTAAETAEINLGTANQNRVAYYVKNAASNVKGTNIGKITGYGVGVYLQGTAAAPGITASQATLDSNTATLDYTTGATGNGIIGLYLAGNTDISAYNKAIKVGDTVDSNYAIGVYTDGQGTLGTPGSPYSINQNITAGKNGVGIFADKSSNLEYNGTMKVGKVGGTGSSSSGVGIYIANQGGTGSKVTLGSTGNIELYGKGGVGAIVTKDSNFTATTGSKIELKEGSGVGVFGLKGSTIDAEHLTFINNGYQAEKIRSIGGKAHIIADETIAQGIVLTHVINGETSLASGKTITASGNNIGLMSEGIKDPATPGWQNGDYEVINKGTLDFSNASNSTALYSISSRLKNEGAIKVGNKSTGIYGEYNKNTPKYDEDVNPLNPTPNKSSIETTASSSITLTNSESSAIYVKNLKNVDNKGSITAATGKTKNLGIYAINDGTANDVTGNQNLDLKNSGAISLGDASVAIYSKGESNTLRNKVENTGDLTVGKQTSEGSAIAIYAENTDVKTNSTATVGENGLVFYGKNSDIEAKGSANFSNKGTLAYLEDSKFTSYLGNLTGADNTILFIKNSQVNLAGNGTPVDVSVAANQTGMQIEGTSSTLEGIKDITLGQNSTAIYLKNGNLTFTADKISSTSNNTKGILAINSDLTNNSKIDLSGDSSVGIYADAPASKTIKNTGDMTLAGKETLGVYLAGAQKYENYGNINIADSADAKHPTIGTYVKGNADVYHKAGDINVGSKSVGIYSKANSLVSVEAGNLNVKDQGTGIYKEKGTVSLAGTLNVAPHTATTKNSEPVGLYARDGVTVTDNLTSTTIGEKSYGIILNSSSTPSTYTNTSSGTVELGNDSTYLYSEGNANITNNRNIAPTANADRSIAFYIKGNGEANTKFVNNGNIDLSVGKGTMGIYAPNAEAVNKANITVGKIDDTDPVTQQVYPKDKITYSIGMATADKGKIYNEGNIILTGNKSLGMYGDGKDTVVENRAGGKIILKPGATATATDKITNMTGVLVNNGATFINNGDITTDINYSYNPNVSGLIGVAVLNGSKLENHGNITIDADNSYGIVIRGKKNADGTITYAEIKNYGNIKVRGTGTTGVSWENVSADDIAALKNQIGAALSADPIKNAIYNADGTDKALEGVDIKIINGQPVVTRNGVVVPSEIVNKIVVANNVGMSDIGFYIDTLGRTKPIDIDMNGASLPPINSQLIIGTEYSKMTNSKQWYVTDGVIQPFLNMIAGQNFKLSSFAGSLTWMATPVLDGSQNIVGISMAKIPYTSFVERTDNAYNFTDGLEQRYDKNALDSEEKEIFTKLNSIGKNEGTLLTQTFDEMMGHQYANVQRRILSTNDFFKRELSSLFEWKTRSKDSNKVKFIGENSEFKTDTAGVIDYKKNTQGVIYLGENETVNLGNSSGFYVALANEKYKFGDIGGSKERGVVGKFGIYNSKAFDYNNSLNWTWDLGVLAGYHRMDRKYLVIDKIYQAKSTYYNYGLEFNNRLSKEFRLSETIKFKPYIGLDLAYGRFTKIREKDGQVRLEVKANDYISIKPNIGFETRYTIPTDSTAHYFVALGAKYEQELGKTSNVQNKARVAYTDAGYYNLRKDKREAGNLNGELSVGIEKGIFGVIFKTGYGTRTKDFRTGVDLRFIF